MPLRHGAAGSIAAPPAASRRRGQRRGAASSIAAPPNVMAPAASQRRADGVRRRSVQGRAARRVRHFPCGVWWMERHPRRDGAAVLSLSAGMVQASAGVTPVIAYERSLLCLYAGASVDRLP